jgi:DNA-binding transcriptional ArsR family regulator
MIIRAEILDKINNPKTRVKIASALSQGELSVIDMIRKNAPNGSLTKVAALKVIAEELGVTQDEILEEVQEEVTK